MLPELLLLALCIIIHAAVYTCYVFEEICRYFLQLHLLTFLTHVLVVDESSPTFSAGNRQRVDDCRDHPYLRPNPFLGPGMNGLRLAPGGMEPVGAGAADPRMGLNTPPDMCPGCKYMYCKSREGGRREG